MQEEVKICIEENKVIEAEANERRELPSGTNEVMESSETEVLNKPKKGFEEDSYDSHNYMIMQQINIQKTKKT